MTKTPENEQAEGLIGKGIYSFPEAARLLRLPVDKARRWMEGYRHHGDRFSTPIVQRDSSGLVEFDALSFLDLMEMHFVAMFRSEGVSAQYLRVAARRAAVEFGTTHPFTVEKFSTDGKRIFATIKQEDVEKEIRSRYLVDYGKSQTVMEVMVKPFLRNLEYSAEFLQRFRPQGPNTPVVLDPQRAFGKPIDEETGIQTLTLYNMIRAGETIDRVAWWHNVKTDSVVAAVTYEESLRYRLAA